MIIIRQSGDPAGTGPMTLRPHLAIGAPSQCCCKFDYFHPNYSNFAAQTQLGNKYFDQIAKLPGIADRPASSE